MPRKVWQPLQYALNNGGDTVSTRSNSTNGYGWTEGGFSPYLLIVQNIASRYKAFSRQTQHSKATLGRKWNVEQQLQEQPSWPSQQWFQDWCLHGKILKIASFAAESQAPVLAFTFYRSKSGRSTMLAHAILNLPSLGQLVRASIPPPGTLQSFNTSQELWCQCSMCWNQSAFRRHATIEYKMRQTAEGSWDCKRSELRRFQARTF